MAKIKTLVTYLEMRERRLTTLPALPKGFELKYINKVNLDEYLNLYKQIGTDYHWVSRLRLTNPELQNILHHADVKVFILYENQVAVGFFELNARNLPKSIEISFVGLIKNAIGRGLGSLITQYAVAYAWAQNPGRVIIQTCTLDHKRALPLYQKLGFEAYNRHVTEFETLVE
ncbi:MAG: GNAT family N-acetyltransferase [Alphaproteobacteria bacterium]|nr:GNAT family N-acetyltransferase [Alphaproteobacteria bacterium]